MLERVISDIIEKEAGKYLQNFNKKQLHIQAFKGDILLENLEIKPEALEGLNLPIRIVKGHVGKISLKIRWRKLMSEPVEVGLEDVVVVAVPDSEWSEKKEQERKAAAQKSKLNADEAMRRLRRDAISSGTVPTGAKLPKFLQRIMENLCITVKNIHICYEDSFTVPERPFVLGMKLGSLELTTTDSEGKSTYVKHLGTMSYKLLEIKDFALYWNADSAFVPVAKQYIAEKLPPNTGLLRRPSMHTAGRSLKPPALQQKNRYVVHPLTAIVRVAICKNDINDMNAGVSPTSSVEDTDKKPRSKSIPDERLLSSGRSSPPLSNNLDRLRASSLSPESMTSKQSSSGFKKGPGQSSVAAIRLTDQPPRTQINVDLKQLQLDVDSSQIQSMKPLVEFLTKYERFLKQRKYRPKRAPMILSKLTQTGASPETIEKARQLNRDWWQYAISLTLDGIRDQMHKMSWKNLQKRRDDRRLYINMRMQLMVAEDSGYVPPAGLVEQLELMEERIPYEDVINYRNMAELEQIRKTRSQTVFGNISSTSSATGSLDMPYPKKRKSWKRAMLRPFGFVKQNRRASEAGIDANISTRSAPSALDNAQVFESRTPTPTQIPQNTYGGEGGHNRSSSPSQIRTGVVSFAPVSNSSYYPPSVQTESALSNSTMSSSPHNPLLAIYRNSAPSPVPSSISPPPRQGSGTLPKVGSTFAGDLSHAMSFKQGKLKKKKKTKRTKLMDADQRLELVAAARSQEELADLIQSRLQAEGIDMDEDELEEFLQDVLYPEYFMFLKYGNNAEDSNSSRAEGRSHGMYEDIVSTRMEINIQHAVFALRDAPRKSFVIPTSMPIKPSTAGITGWKRIRLLTSYMVATNPDKDPRNRLGKLELDGISLDLKQKGRAGKIMDVHISLQNITLRDLTFTTHWPLVVSCLPYTPVPVADSASQPSVPYVVIDVRVASGLAHVAIKAHHLKAAYTRWVSSMIAFAQPSRPGRLDLQAPEHADAFQSFQKLQSRTAEELMEILLPNTATTIDIRCEDIVGVLPEESHLDVPLFERGPRGPPDSIIIMAEVPRCYILVQLVSAEAKRRSQNADKKTAPSGDAKYLQQVRKNEELYDYIKLTFFNVDAYFCRESEWRTGMLKRDMNYRVAEKFNMIFEIWKVIKYKALAMRITFGHCHHTPLHAENHPVIVRISIQQFRMLLGVIKSITTGLKNAKMFGINRWMHLANKIQRADIPEYQEIGVFPHGAEVSVYGEKGEFVGVHTPKCHVAISKRGREMYIRLIADAKVDCYNFQLDSWEPLVEWFSGEIEIRKGVTPLPGDLSEGGVDMLAVTIRSPYQPRLNLNMGLLSTLGMLAKDWQLYSKHWETSLTPRIIPTNFSIRNDTHEPISFTLNHEWGMNWCEPQRLEPSGMQVLPFGPHGAGFHFSRFDPSAPRPSPLIDVHFLQKALCSARPVRFRSDRDGLYVARLTGLEKSKDPVDCVCEIVTSNPQNLFGNVYNAFPSRQRNLIIRSSVQVKNSTEHTLDACVDTSDESEGKHLFQLPPGGIQAIPIHLAATGRLWIRPSDYLGLRYDWQRFPISLRRNLTSANPLQWDSSDLECVAGPNDPPFAFRLELDVAKHYVYLTGRPPAHGAPLVVVIRPPIFVENLLASYVRYVISDGSNGKMIQGGVLEVGATTGIHQVNPCKDELQLQLQFSREESVPEKLSDPVRICGSKTKPNVEVKCACASNADLGSIGHILDSALDDRIITIVISTVIDGNSKHNDIRRVSLSCSHWIINETKIPLRLRVSNSNEIAPIPPVEARGPIMFSVRGKKSSGGGSVGQRKKFNIQAGNASSDWFYLEKAKNKSTLVLVSDQSNLIDYEFAVTATKAPGDLASKTKLVTIAPRVLLVNCFTESALEYEVGDRGAAGDGISLLPCQENTPIYWPPLPSRRVLRIRKAGEGWSWSGRFTIEDGTTILRVRNTASTSSCIVRMTVHTKKGTTYVYAAEEKFVPAENAKRSIEPPKHYTYRIENGLPLDENKDGIEIKYQQEGCDIVDVLKPGEWSAFGWDDPIGAPSRVQVHIRDPVNSRRVLTRSYSWDGDVDAFEHVSGPHKIFVKIFFDTGTKVLRFWDDKSSDPYAFYQSKRQKISAEVFVPGAGVSFSDDRPKEIVYITIENFQFYYQKWGPRMITDIKIGKMQIDNEVSSSQLPPFPVLLASERRTFDPSLPMIAFRLQQCSTGPSLNLKLFQLISAQLQTLEVRVDEDAVLQVMEFVQRFLASRRKPYDHSAWVLSLSSCALARSKLHEPKRIQIDLLELPEIRTRLSFRKQDPIHHHSFSPAETLVRAAGVMMLSVDRAPLHLRSLKITSLITLQKELTKPIMKHYISQIAPQIAAVLGSADVFGTPVSLVAKAGHGIRDLFHEPVVGARRSPAGFGKGVARGLSSFLKNTAFAPLAITSKITKSLGRGLDAISHDAEFVRKRHVEQEERPEDIADGLLLGGRNLALSLVRALEGIVMDPYRGAESEGVAGFGKGVVRGLVGLISKPTSGALDLVSKVCEGIYYTPDVWRTAAIDPVIERERLPRNFRPNQTLYNFSADDAEIACIVKGLAYPQAQTIKTLISRNECILYHKGLPGRRLFVVSDYRVLYIRRPRTLAASQERRAGSLKVSLLTCQPLDKETDLIGGWQIPLKDLVGWESCLYNVGVLLTERGDGSHQRDKKLVVCDNQTDVNTIINQLNYICNGNLWVFV
mmetsp:Transcript_44846/g.73032  ORF Transcript_44846/g.73032 Transcript_44846/m.73032 type:complete len:2714 (+) Transcript_44846:96-8237(+)